MKTIPLDNITYLHKIYLKHLGSPAYWNPMKNNARADVVETMDKAFEIYKKTSNVWKELSVAPIENFYLWSDLHIGHANIIKMCDRPVSNVEEMDFLMLENAKTVVTENDWLFFGGDVAMKNPPHLKTWLRECPGKKVLVLGNHDIRKIDEWLKLGFDAVSSCWIKTLTNEEKSFLKLANPKFNIERLWFTHYPIDKNLIPPNTLNIHGHIHEKVLKGDWINISVEQQNLSPKRLDDVLNKIIIS